MLDETKYTHVIWLQRWEAGRFIEWLQVGKARIETDSCGHIRAHSRQVLMPIGGWNGLTCILPAGEQPTPPEDQPTRPKD
jgi:hypothetical protein